MKSRKLIIAFAIILPLIGVLSMVAWANNARKAAYDNATLYSVVRVVKDIPAGTKTSELSEYVTTVKVPKAILPFDDEGNPLYMENLSDADDGTTDYVIPAGQILLNSQILTEEERTETYATQPGDIEVTLKLDGSRGSSKSIRIGDKVTIFGSLDDAGVKRTEIVARSVVVTQIDGSTKADTKADQEETDPDALVTVSGSPETIQEIIYVLEFGTVWLGLENPGSDDVELAPTTESDIGTGEATTDDTLTDN